MPEPITLQDMHAWLTAYGQAWEQGDADAAAALFAADAAYHETPFDPPMQGQAAIHQYWTEGANQSQTDVTFRFQILAITNDLGIAHWQATFTRVPSGQKVALDGILTAQFNGEGRCQVFREWWHRQQ